MATNDDKTLESLGLSAEEQARAIAEEQKRLKKLADEVAQRYDPSRLSRISVAGAGTAEKIDDATRREMERRLGASFGDVRIVRGAFADRVLKHHRAEAVTLGATGIILVKDSPRSSFKTPEGRGLLAHELTHVKQAQGGMKFALESGSHNEAHERAAYEVQDQVANEAALGSAGTAGDDPEDKRDRMVDRVLEKVAEARRHDLELYGFDDK